MNRKLKLILNAIMLVGTISSVQAQTIPSGAQDEVLRLYQEQFMPRGNAVVQVAQTPFDAQADILRQYREQFMPRDNAVDQVAQTSFDLQADLLRLYREQFVPHENTDVQTNALQTEHDISLAFKPMK